MEVLLDTITMNFITDVSVLLKPQQDWAMIHWKVLFSALSTSVFLAYHPQPRNNQILAREYLSCYTSY